MRTTRDSLLSDTVIDDFNTSLQIDDTDSSRNTHNETELSELNPEQNDDEVDKTINDSITQLKQVVHNNNDAAESLNVKTSANDNTQVKAICDDSCQVKRDSKKRYDMTRCVQCAIWFHDTCVGIEKDEPIGLWMCKSCRDIPQITTTTCTKRRH